MIRLRDRSRFRRAASAGSEAPISPAAGSDFRRELVPTPLAFERQPVTSMLYERLGDEDIAEVERLMAEGGAAQHLGAEASNTPTLPFYVLSYGMWFGASSVAEKTGLSSAQPPDHIHAMARGPLAAAGGLYEADLVVDALASAGTGVEDVRRALDFGCSSGRVVRVLAVAYPHVAWMACDPNEAATTWATEHLPGIEFFVNAQEPPLPVEEGSLDLVYAISIWSHFAPGLGLRWFDEMRRVIHPGGHLVLTTHGLQSVAFYARSGLRGFEQTNEILQALYSRGWWYAPEFGEQGDWGVVNSDWGTAFLSPEWILAELSPRWRVLNFAPGGNTENQDVYVLQRV
jgi:SAM-dependent methyltransferase